MSDRVRCNQLGNLATAALSYGFTPIPILGKVPRVKEWQSTRVDPKDPLALVRRIVHLCEIPSPIADNIGVVTGSASGVVVLDIDSDNRGVELWNQAIDLNGPFPETFTVLTGKSGLHYYWKYDERTSKITQTAKILGYPWDFRADGGMIIFPGSIHPTTGEVYSVVAGYPQNKPHIAEMPEWVYQMLLTNQHLRGHAV